MILFLQNDYNKNSEFLLRKVPRKSQTNTFKSSICRQEKATTAAFSQFIQLKIIIFVLNYLTVSVYPYFN